MQMTIAELKSSARKNNGHIVWEDGFAHRDSVMVEVNRDGEIYLLPDADGFMCYVGRCA
jgi:hypothetical protein